MKLAPLDTPERLQLVTDWLAQKNNYQWLDFGDPQRRLTPEWLKIATQRRTDVFRIFTSDDDVPIGVVGLGNVNAAFKTAHIWVVLGDKAYAGRGYATRGFSKILTLGFVELGLHAINTWCVEHNNPSICLVKRNNFQPVGRQRRCHYIDGHAYDRLWFDILASEHKEI